MSHTFSPYELGLACLNYNEKQTNFIDLSQLYGEMSISYQQAIDKNKKEDSSRNYPKLPMFLAVHDEQQKQKFIITTFHDDLGTACTVDRKLFDTFSKDELVAYLLIVTVFNYQEKPLLSENNELSSIIIDTMINMELNPTALNNVIKKLKTYLPKRRNSRLPQSLYYADYENPESMFSLNIDNINHVGSFIDSHLTSKNHGFEFDDIIQYTKLDLSEYKISHPNNLPITEDKKELYQLLNIYWSIEQQCNDLIENTTIPQDQNALTANLESLHQTLNNAEKILFEIHLWFQNKKLELYDFSKSDNVLDTPEARNKLLKLNSTFNNIVALLDSRIQKGCSIIKEHDNSTTDEYPYYEVQWPRSIELKINNQHIDNILNLEEYSNSSDSREIFLKLARLQSSFSNNSHFFNVSNGEERALTDKLDGAYQLKPEIIETIKDKVRPYIIWALKEQNDEELKREAVKLAFSFEINFLLEDYIDINDLTNEKTIEFISRFIDKDSNSLHGYKHCSTLNNHKHIKSNEFLQNTDQQVMNLLEIPSTNDTYLEDLLSKLLQLKNVYTKIQPLINKNPIISNYWADRSYDTSVVDYFRNPQFKSAEDLDSTFIGAFFNAMLKAVDEEKTEEFKEFFKHHIADFFDIFSSFTSIERAIAELNEQNRYSNFITILDPDFANELKNNDNDKVAPLTQLFNQLNESCLAFAKPENITTINNRVANKACELKELVFATFPEIQKAPNPFIVSIIGQELTSYLIADNTFQMTIEIESLFTDKINSLSSLAEEYKKEHQLDYSRPQNENEYFHANLRQATESLFKAYINMVIEPAINSDSNRENFSSLYRFATFEDAKQTMAKVTSFIDNLNIEAKNSLAKKSSKELVTINNLLESEFEYILTAWLDDKETPEYPDNPSFEQNRLESVNANSDTLNCIIDFFSNNVVKGQLKSKNANKLAAFLLPYIIQQHENKNDTQKTLEHLVFILSILDPSHKEFEKTTNYLKEAVLKKIYPQNATIEEQNNARDNIVAKVMQIICEKEIPFEERYNLKHWCEESFFLQKQSIEQLDSTLKINSNAYFTGSEWDQNLNNLSTRNSAFRAIDFLTGRQPLPVQSGSSTEFSKSRFRQFWNLPQNIRILVIIDLLESDTKHSFNEKFDYMWACLNELDYQNQPDLTVLDNKQDYRAILKAEFDSRPDYQKTIFLAGLISNIQPPKILHDEELENVSRCHNQETLREIIERLNTPFLLNSILMGINTPSHRNRKVKRTIIDLSAIELDKEDPMTSFNQDQYDFGNCFFGNEHEHIEGLSKIEQERIIFNLIEYNLTKSINTSHATATKKFKNALTSSGIDMFGNENDTLYFHQSPEIQEKLHAILTKVDSYSIHKQCQFYTKVFRAIAEKKHELFCFLKNENESNLPNKVNLKELYQQKIDSIRNNGWFLNMLSEVHESFTSVEEASFVKSAAQMATFVGGVTYTKAVQFLDSYENTPDHIRQYLQESKSKAPRPNRAIIFTQMHALKDHLEKDINTEQITTSAENGISNEQWIDLLNQVEQQQAVLEEVYAGSANIASTIRTADNQKVMLIFQRDHSLGQMNRGRKRLHEVLERFNKASTSNDGKEDLTQYTDISGLIPQNITHPLVEHSTELQEALETACEEIAQELDIEQVILRQEMAENTYSSLVGRTISIPNEDDEIRVHFDVPKILNHTIIQNPEDPKDEIAVRLMEFAPGKTFNSFTQDEDVPSETKKAVAQAIFYSAMKQLLSGSSFDLDWHGGNSVIEQKDDGRVYVHIIDTGQRLLEQSEMHQNIIAAMAEQIIKMSQDQSSEQSIDLGTLITKLRKETPEWIESQSNFSQQSYQASINQIAQSLFALQDIIRRGKLDQDDLKHVFKNVLSSLYNKERTPDGFEREKGISPKVEDRINKAIAESKGGLTALFLKFLKPDKKIIENKNTEYAFSRENSLPPETELEGEGPIPLGQKKCAVL